MSETNISPCHRILFLRSRDVWFVGTLIWEIFNGSGTPNYRQIGSIPRPLSVAYGELINPNPSIRNSCEKLLQSTFIQSNPLVECLLFLEQIQVGNRKVIQMYKDFELI